MAAETATPPVLQSTSLQELAGGSSAFGEWILKIDDVSMDHEYSYQWQGNQRTGKYCTVRLVSEEPSLYCTGKLQRRGKEPEATRNYKASKEKFMVGTVWKFSKVALAKEQKLYIGSPVKVVIDLNQTRATPVLQSTRYANLEPSPAGELATLLGAPLEQRVDVTALVIAVSPTRSATTAKGAKLVADVTIRDNSGPKGASEVTFPIFVNDSSVGRVTIEQLEQDVANNTPVTFFNLVISKVESQDGAPEHAKPQATMRTDFERFQFKAAKGAKATALAAAAAELKARTDADIDRVACLAPFVPREAVDYTFQEAVLTVVRLLEFLVKSAHNLPKEPMLLQINHIRVLEPAADQPLLTNKNNRIFLLLKIMDHSGQLELRIREKTVLSLSGFDKDEFVTEAANGGINFPILCSVRVHLTWDHEIASEEDASSQAGASEHRLSAIIVEAAAQCLDSNRSNPNASMTFINDILKPLPPTHDRVISAPLKHVKHSPFGGLVVEDPQGVRHTCACVLTLVAHIGKSKMTNCAGGHRIVSSEIWNIPFPEPAADAEEGAPEHSDAKLGAECISYCTMQNVQSFTMSSRAGKEPYYALIVVSSAHVTESSGFITFMVDKVQPIQSADVPAYRKTLVKLSAISKDARTAGATDAKRPFDPRTPLEAKKTRRLSQSPTDASLPDM